MKAIANYVFLTFFGLIVTQCSQWEIQKPNLLQYLLVFSAPTTVGVIASDLGSGGRFKTFDPNSLTVSPTSVTIHSDAVGRFYEDKVIIINRLNRDSIQILDPRVNFLTVLDFSVGQGRNPQDAVLYNQKLYVALYNSDVIPIYNAQTGTLISEISLTKYRETFSSSGTPDRFLEIGSLVNVGSSLFVSLQRLDRNDVSGYFPPNSDSILVEIDMNLDRIVAEYKFPIRNPSSRIVKKVLFGEPHLLFSCVAFVGFLSRNDGGILAFHLPSRSFRNEILFSEGVAGGDIINFVIRDESLGYAITLDAAFNKSVQSFRPSTGERTGTVLTIPGNRGITLSGMHLTAEGKLIVGLTDFTLPGLNVYDTNQGNLLLNPSPISVELTPLDIFQLQNP
ncbi:hypothetical protein LPTSP4_18060 [Leptospira ryugenii]|uniref:Uncharacterized protein n=1 Tax=Leptospira ryugenii TaxID=1917863 RepID=A0A2P2E083_9LEPT|nr:hypothetical protein [Leptospira ryugenii]GBF50281.1 hypothetical protein LPTSP4_18060 [Leptospira ryugenii]